MAKYDLIVPFEHGFSQTPLSRRGLSRGFVVLGLALAPSLWAIGSTVGFTTQDGPAHIYSARIINASLLPDSPFASTFRVAWEPLPNWAGHLVTMAAVAVWSPDVANRVVAAGTLISLGAAIVWLRWVVSGHAGIEIAALLAALLTLNVTWLLGFTSFLLGATTVPITLGVWWLKQDRLEIRGAVGLALLLILGYFCHPISLGITLGGLMVLSLWGPGANRLPRVGWTALSLVPLIPLGISYWLRTRSGGGLDVVWDHWNPSLVGLVSQVGWVDPISLAAKTTSPFEMSYGVFPTSVLAPAVWFALGIIGLISATWRHCERDKNTWLIMAAGLLVTGIIAPDTLGVKHGHFLPQRIALLGLVMLVPWLRLQADSFATRIAVGTLVGALAIQSLFVWDYARTCHERVAPFLQVAARFEPNTRSGTLLNAIRGRFRANPVLHADGLIAASTDSIFWTNYEMAQYYFPVKVRDHVVHPVATSFEEVAILDEPRDADRRALLWRQLLRNHGAQLDKIIEWNADPQLDQVTSEDYQISDHGKPIRVWSRSPQSLKHR